MSIKAATPARHAKPSPAPASPSAARQADRPSKPKFSLAAPQAAAPRASSAAPSAPTPSRLVRALSDIEAERAKLDRVIARATRGGTFTPAQLLGLQAQIYRLSQDMEITSRVLDRGVGTLKSILGMQV